ncbi:MAG: hypothetical protein NXY57DRAFT_1014076 [Lentinula lateritia]|uniref:Gamma interferon inducible lysosomal thiol reductase n=1 Tax=Lentinula lateritia TaxID=40482 RepID=A0ABQ8VMR7_9AGAR|nr:MAG: hypothetical protein NXY57DRAFT_1014076 [Lentinula lateritia]KAJ4497679.1 hypothetical protein C8R41DRAFT_822024 [Lentinula lateritia]
MTRMTAFTFLAFFANVLLVPATVLSFIQDATQNVLSDAKVDVDIKVPVTLGVMSRCPDALLCENSMDAVLKKVGNKIDLKLVYIAKINSSEPDFGATCMHGPEECAGNVQQLCAAKYSPFANWWEFVQCNNYEGRNKIGLPDTARKCAHTAQIDLETSGVGECAGLDASGKGAEGVRLLHKSVALGKTMGLEKSCTIYINGEKVCVHDETWKECENGHTVSDFTRQINEAYDKLNA